MAISGSDYDQRKVSEPEDKIGIIVILRVLWRLRILVISVTIGCSLGALLINSLLPRIYNFSTLLEPPKGGFYKKGKRSCPVTARNIQETILSGIFNEALLNDLQGKLNSLEDLSFKVDRVGDGMDQFVRIEYENSDVELGIQVLEKLIALVKSRVSGEVRDWSKNIDVSVDRTKQRILEVQNDINGYIQEELRGLEEEIDNLRLHEKSRKEMEILALRQKKCFEEDIAGNAVVQNSKIVEYIEALKGNIGLLNKMKNDAASRGMPINDFNAACQVLDTMRTMYKSLNEFEHRVSENNLRLLQAKQKAKLIEKEIKEKSEEKLVSKTEKHLLEKIFETKEKIISLEERIRLADNGNIKDGFDKKMGRRLKELESASKKQRNEMRKLGVKLSDFERQKEGVQNMRVLQSPKSSSAPVKPKTIRNLLFGLFAGFMAGCFIAIFKEFVVNYGRDTD